MQTYRKMILTDTGQKSESFFGESAVGILLKLVS